LTRRTTHPETREIHEDIDNIDTVEGRRIVYVDDIVTICRRENLLKLHLFKEELMKKYEIIQPDAARAASKLAEFLRNLQTIWKHEAFVHQLNLVDIKERI